MCLNLCFLSWLSPWLPVERHQTRLSCASWRRLSWRGSRFWVQELLEPSTRSVLISAFRIDSLGVYDGYVVPNIQKWAFFLTKDSHYYLCCKLPKGNDGKNKNPNSCMYAPQPEHIGHPRNEIVIMNFSAQMWAHVQSSFKVLPCEKKEIRSIAV